MMKKVDSAVNAIASGDGWFRIFYEGYNNSTGQWCDERTMTDGRLSVNLPTDLVGGYYLVRPEILALHAAAGGDPQFYVSCIQIFLESGGSAVPKDTMAIPSDEYAKNGSPTMTFDSSLLNHDPSYPNYGPPCYHSTAQAVSPPPGLNQTEGLKSPGCVLEVGRKRLLYTGHALL
ncbi:MAG: hypothetical protein M1826_001541 [Phylliscum demangeonii]|nr:MAG: hypothetical protein M1826_001541 [Phylliscum demangeonii]